MSKTVQWGVLGTAKIARTQLCPAIHLAAGGRLHAIASRSAEKAQLFVAQYPDLEVHGSYDALLADPKIDAIYIPLPNDMHVEMTRACLAAGKHVLCEKPIAMTADEISPLIKLRDKAGLLAAEAFMVAHHPQWPRVREVISAGEIGKLVHVSGVFTYNNSADPGNIRNSAAHGGGGLADIGVYPVVTTRLATGEEPSDVVSRIDWRDGVDLSARVLAEFPGFTMDFYCSMRMALRQEMLFHGQDGWIRVLAPFNPDSYGDGQLEIRLADGSTRIERYGEVNQYKLMIEAFNRSVAHGVPFSCTLEFSRGNQAMIDMIKAADPG